jgi:hypothetical protein
MSDEDARQVAHEVARQVADEVAQQVAKKVARQVAHEVDLDYHGRSVVDDPRSSLAVANMCISDVTTAVDQIPNLYPHSTVVLPSCSDGIDFCRNAQWCADGSSVLGVMEGASVEVLDM